MRDKRWLAHPAHLLLVRLSKLTLQCGGARIGGRSESATADCGHRRRQKGYETLIVRVDGAQPRWAVRAKARTAGGARRLRARRCYLRRAAIRGQVGRPRA